MAIPQPILKAAGTLAADVVLGAAAAAIIAKIPNNPDLQDQTPYSTNILKTYPSDLPLIKTPTNPNGEVFCMLLSFYQYQRPSILVAPTLVPYGAIALPIPSSLIDQSRQSFSEETSSPAVGSALENYGGGGISAIFKNIGLGLENVASGGSIGGISAAAGAAARDPNVINKALAFKGVVQNPFLSMLYNSPTFKRYSFSWTFIPETVQDTETLNYIFNKIRFHSFPDINSTIGGVLLNYPDMVRPTLLPSGYMFDFKQCVVEGVSINYAAGDTPSFTTKNAPSAYQMTLNLIEIEFWTKSDLAITNSNFGPFGGGGVLNSINGFTPYGSDS